MINKRFVFFILAFVFITTSTYLLIQFARGYKLDISEKTFRPTGLLVVTSLPDGGQIITNGKLTGATNTTLSLAPDTYDVEIKKDGYHHWEKTVKIEKEIVTKIDAWLFPLVPNFRALTFTGADNPLLSPDSSKIVYTVSGEIPEKNGLWIIDLTDLPFGLSREPKIIAKNTARIDFSKAAYRWSPDSRQILVTLEQNQTSPAPSQKRKGPNFILDPNNLINTSGLIDITNNLPLTLIQWDQEEKIKQDQRLSKLPKDMAEIIKTKTKGAIFSPDETKMFYTATASATISDKLIPVSLLNYSVLTEQRQLKPNQIYVYDIKEDRNFLILENKKADILSWFPTSSHLLLVEKDKISIIEYDGGNLTTLYAGHYQFPFAFPFPSGNKLLILTTISNTSSSAPNLYAISLR